MEYPDLDKLQDKEKVKVLVTLDKKEYDELKELLDVKKVPFSKLVNNWVCIAKDFYTHEHETIKEDLELNVQETEPVPSKIDSESRSSHNEL